MRFHRPSSAIRLPFRHNRRYIRPQLTSSAPGCVSPLLHLAQRLATTPGALRIRSLP
jgi:hypothetical protein